MVEFLRTYQSEMMYVLSGISGMIALFACITRFLSRTRKAAQIIMAVSAMLLLLGENFGEVFYGDTSTTGFWMVRISNFVVFLATLLVVHSFALYLWDVFRIDLKIPAPRRLWLVMFIMFAGEALVIFSQFSGLYYTFDEMNQYHRSPGFVISYIAPLLSAILLLSIVLGYRSRFRRMMWVMMILFTAVPVIASIIQLFIYGIYLTDMATVGMVVALYLFTLADTNRQLERAQQRELQLLKENQEHTRRLFSQTAIALVDSIDAKDTYTQGHSNRVARYSRMIAEISGKTEEECDDVFYAALLHDVGKIGIPDAIINKKGKLTLEEFEVIKSHPVIGDQILSEISGFPYLASAARHHHERYDGMGYPDRLKGEEIPELARIISVADAYDAMTSNRSYRSHLPQDAVRRELTLCSGTQFDPGFAKIMVELIDRDTGYTMREQ